MFVFHVPIYKVMTYGIKRVLSPHNSGKVYRLSANSNPAM